MIQDIHQLIDVITGYQPAAVVSAATRMGVFGALSPDRPRAAPQLAEELEVTEEPLVKLLAALEWLGLVSRLPEGFVSSEFAARELDGELAAVVEKEAFFARVWTDLAESMTTGRPRLAPWRQRLETDPDQAHGFLRALDVLARRTGPPLASLPQLAPDRRVVDIGGGLGSYSRLLEQAGSEVTLVDLEPVARWARRDLEDTGVTVVACDVFTHDSCGVEPEAFDAALVSHFVHDLDRDQAVDLLQRAARAVRAGGCVVVNDFAADTGPGGFGPLFDLMMTVETGGNAYPRAELTEMMAEAGLEEVSMQGFDPPLTVASGMRP